MSNSIPNDLLSRTREIFLLCREFSSNQSLRAFFQLNLRPFQMGLPEGSSIEERVDFCMAHVGNKRFSGTGRFLWVVMLEKLRDRYDPGDELHHAIEQLCIEFTTVLDLAQPLYYVSNEHKNKLFDQILRLDFRNQIRMVNEVIDQQPVAAFIIHGPPDYGQQILAYRLSHLRPQWESGRYITLDAGAAGKGNSSRSLWREVAKCVELPYDTDPVHLAERVCEWIKTQDVIITIHTVDYIPPPILSQLINEFWLPLATLARQSSHLRQAHTHLLLFLVDYAGCVCETGISFIDQPAQIIESYLPLRLPPASLFPSEEIDVWLDMASDLLPKRLSVQAVLAATNEGIPNLVYEEICSNCGISWEGELIP